MDWNSAIEDNRRMLKRIVALLFALAGLAERLIVVPRPVRALCCGSCVPPRQLHAISSLKQHGIMACQRRFLPAEASLRCKTGIALRRDAACAKFSGPGDPAELAGRAQFRMRNAVSPRAP